MRVTIDGVAYVVTELQCQKAFKIMFGYAIDGIDADAAKLLKSLTPAKSRGRPKGTSTFDLKRAKQLRKQGQTYPEIAAELGCSSRTVIRKLKGGE